MKLVAIIANAISARPLLTRWILAGPVALILAIVTMASMPFWLPEGPAKVDHLAFPIVLFPLIWTITVVYPCLADNLPRATLIMLGLTVMQAALVTSAFV
ncbi:MAG: hypothetical protein AAF557_11250 [Pseudomonadota bacterium]